MPLFTEIVNFIADDILKLKRYLSPIDNTTKLRKKDFLKEENYLRDFDFMIDTIEDCIFVSPDASVEFERKKALDSDYLFFELCHKANTYGPESCTEEELEFLENYKNTNDISLI